MKAKDRTLKTAPKYKCGWSVLKSTEGGRGTADLKRAFKSKRLPGVLVDFHSSCYVGHTAFQIFAANKKAMDSAAAVLVDCGYVLYKKQVLRYMSKI